MAMANEVVETMACGTAGEETSAVVVMVLETLEVWMAELTVMAVAKEREGRKGAVAGLNALQSGSFVPCCSSLE